MKWGFRLMYICIQSFRAMGEEMEDVLKSICALNATTSASFDIHSLHGNSALCLWAIFQRHGQPSHALDISLCKEVMEAEWIDVEQSLPEIRPSSVMRVWLGFSAPLPRKKTNKNQTACAQESG